MDKTIIALQGRANIGKTDTIKKFRNILKQTFPNFHERLFIDDFDIKTIIEITYEDEKVKVGIESQGDPYSRLTSENLNDFTSADCNIIICACRTSGRTVNVIRKVANNNNYNQIFISTYVSNNKHEILNPLMAQHLLDIVKNVI